MVFMGRVVTPKGGTLKINVDTNGIVQVLTPNPTHAPTTSPTYSQAPTPSEKLSKKSSNLKWDNYKYLYILVILIPIFLYLWRQNKTIKELQAGNKVDSSAGGVVDGRVVVPISRYPDTGNDTGTVNNNNTLSYDQNGNRQPSSTVPI